MVGSTLSLVGKAFQKAAVSGESMTNRDCFIVIFLSNFGQPEVATKSGIVRSLFPSASLSTNLLTAGLSSLASLQPFPLLFCPY